MGRGDKKTKKGKKPKAIIVVHLYGMPAKMNEITEIKIPIGDKHTWSQGYDI